MGHSSTTKHGQILYTNQKATKMTTIEVGIEIDNKIINTHGVVDTASDRTCVNMRFINKHKLKEKLRKNNSSITSSNGERFRTTSVLEAMLQFRNNKKMKSRICVIEELPVQVLIGLDCLARLGTIQFNANQNRVMDSNGICLLNKETKSADTNDFNFPTSVFADSVLNNEEINKMKKLILEFRDIFCEKKKEAICETYEATIPLKEELGEYIYTPATTIPLNYQTRAQKVIDTWLEDGKIEPCQSSFNSRILCVPKPLKEGQTEPDLRICIDYRRLNSFLPSDPIITQKLSNLMMETGPHKYRSSFDLPDAYMQIKIKPEDRHKTAFCFNGKQYQFITLPFGLRVSGSSFIRVMSEVMEGLDRREIRNYIDDILLTNESFTDHLNNTRKFFERCRIKRIKLSTAKAVIGQKQIKFLGVILQEEGFGVNKKKIQAILDINDITSIKELRSFIGMVSF